MMKYRRLLDVSSFSSPDPATSQDLHGHLSRTNTITEKYGFQRLLDQNCRPGCTVEVTVVRQKKPRTKPVRGDGPFRILTIANSHDWRCLQLGDLLEAFNVVLVSTGVLGSQTHRNWLSDMFFKWALDGSCSGKAMSARQEKLHECVDHWHEKDSFLQAALRSAPAFLESMWWNRKGALACCCGPSLAYRLANTVKNAKNTKNQRFDKVFTSLH